MTDIQECAKKYLSLKNKTYTYKLENDFSFSIKFTEDNFLHLFGLQKLTDITQIKNLINEKSKIFQKILNNEDSFVEIITNSKHYNKIENRIQYFDYIDDLFDLETCNIIVDFDVTRVPSSKLKRTEFLLYKKLPDDTYFILTIGNRNGFLYPETIIYEKTKMYLSEQTLLDIVDIQVESRKKSRKNNKKNEYKTKRES